VLLREYVIHYPKKRYPASKRYCENCISKQSLPDKFDCQIQLFGTRKGPWIDREHYGQAKKGERNEERDKIWN
jgi:hypothetical protein